MVQQLLQLIHLISLLKTSHSKYVNKSLSIFNLAMSLLDLDALIRLRIVIGCTNFNTYFGFSKNLKVLCLKFGPSDLHRTAIDALDYVDVV
jgi:hypothetical protein